MKKIILIIPAIFLFACSSYNEENICYSGTLVVLKKETKSPPRGNGYWYYLYIFDGKIAKLYETNKVDYDKYEVNDTLPTLVLKTILTKNN